MVHSSLNSKHHYITFKTKKCSILGTKLKYMAYNFFKLLNSVNLKCTKNFTLRVVTRLLGALFSNCGHASSANGDPSAEPSAHMRLFFLFVCFKSSYIDLKSLTL